MEVTPHHEQLPNLEATRLFTELSAVANYAKRHNVIIGTKTHVGHQIQPPANDGKLRITTCQPNGDEFFMKGVTDTEVARGIISMNVRPLVKELDPTQDYFETSLMHATGALEQRRIIVIDDNGKVVMLDKPNDTYMHRTDRIALSDVALLKTVDRASRAAISIYEKYGGYDDFVAALGKELGQRPDMTSITAVDAQHFRLFVQGLDPLMEDLFSVGWKKPGDSIDTEKMFHYRHSPNRTIPINDRFEREEREQIQKTAALFAKVASQVQEDSVGVQLSSQKTIVEQ